ncbi:uncharacterized protein MELLADRAFT_104064 [Melampsora larici-populina 98AG31]|uniref:GH26 domain-containing protein n=1 Tax=Melampsora larici-populina (strain 98AG31 / pathotype 3-4-7) TaxID=747676 RepID=F4RDF6_MELLP|nr:uncharacterized protein MELLADRAFT_104064 [Melampsora larici-populina 98AG31]EGG09617.1 hypothetical protein MELLADRAFT_104064 [Melampsora larici-populina 98AG31]
MSDTKRPRKNPNPTLGLNPHNLHKNGVAIGFLPGFGEPISPNSPSQINGKLPAPMAIVSRAERLRYQIAKIIMLCIVRTSGALRLGCIKRLNGNPVWQIALMPYQGLETVTQQVMNGEWYKWGMQPKLFLRKWKMISQAVKSRTSRTYMLWAPNALTGGVNDVRGGYAPYWPGAQYVDILGFERKNVLPDRTKALKVIKKFSDLYSTPNNLPVVLSETGASYTVSLETGRPAPGGASEHDMKLRWLKQLLGDNLIKSVPNFKAFSWFEVKKNEDAS